MIFEEKIQWFTFAEKDPPENVILLVWYKNGFIGTATRRSPRWFNLDGENVPYQNLVDRCAGWAFISGPILPPKLAKLQKQVERAIINQDQMFGVLVAEFARDDLERAMPESLKTAFQEFLR